MDHNDINMPAAKAATAIGTATISQVSDTVTTAVGPHIALFDLTWPNIASACAALYTFCLITEWFWKKLWRPFFERRGWIKPIPRRVYSVKELQAIAEQQSVTQL